MKNITLISDWQTNEPYVAMLKGRLLNAVPEAHIFDLSHTIDVMDINRTAFLLKSAYAAFGEGSVHLALTGVSENMAGEVLVLQHGGHFFIAPDEGIFALMFQGEIAGKVRAYSVAGGSFVQRMIALCAACFDGTLAEKSVEFPSPKMKMPFGASYFANRNSIFGHVMYVDAQTNVLTDIPVELFEQHVDKECFRARVGSFTITRYHPTYVPDEEPYFLPNSLGVMEIAVFRGRLAILARWQKDTDIEIYCGK